MVCPYCGQEHPDTFKFCPNTAKQLFSQFKACTNEQCVDFGKHILPLESKFCPSCGMKLIKQEDDDSTFLSFFNIKLGKTNIYDIDADEYVKSESPFISGLKIISINNIEIQRNRIAMFAKQSDRKVFGIEIHDLNVAELPKQWLSLGIHPNDIMLSMEKVLGKRNFVWEEHNDPYEGTIGIAYKEIQTNIYIFIAISEKTIVLLYLSKEMKDSLYDQLTNNDEEISNVDEANSNEDEVNSNENSCPKCNSHNIEDDGTDYLQYTCNECGHNWGHDDTVECPECGSDDIENDGTDYLQYECNNCGHVWGDEDVQENEDAIFQKLCSIIVDKMGVDEEEIKYSARFVEDLGADSLDLVELTMEIEKEFLISIPDDVAENLNTVGEVVDYVGKQSM